MNFRLTILIPAMLILCNSLIAQSLIVSDTSWKGTPIFENDWTQNSFSDTHWSFAALADPLIDCGILEPVCDSTGRCRIWDASDDSIAYLRYSFSIFDFNSIDSMNLSIIVDDDFELYINGAFVTDNADCIANGTQLDFIINQFQEGENVIAVKALDCGGCRGVKLRLKVFPFLSIPSGSHQLAHLKPNISVFPNPSSGQFQINFPGNTSGAVLLKVLDTYGINIHEQRNHLDETGVEKLNLRHLHQGQYLLKIEIQDLIWSKKLVIIE